MKINYNLKDKYMQFYNEANGIFLLKKKLKKNPNIKIRSYLSHITLQAVLYIIFYVIIIALCLYMNLNVLKFVICLLAISVFIYFLELIIFFLMVNSKRNSREGTLEINEEGIFDKPKDGLQLGFPYNCIELIVITNDLIVIIANRSVMILIDRKENDKDKITNKIKEYSDIEIIDKTNG